MPHLRGSAARLEVLYPSTSAADVIWYPDTAELVMTLPRCPSAVLLRITER
jgi:alpha-galactosidase